MANKVIAGEYKDRNLCYTAGKLMIAVSFTKRVQINKDTVESYEVVTEDIRKSAASGVGRGIVGSALLGPVGLLAGLSAKNKGRYQIVIQFKDGCKSLIDVDSKIYKYLIKELF